MSIADCLFCKIVAGEIPTDAVHRTEGLLAFRDINPQAPVHILIIPTEHITSLDVALDGHRDVLGEMMLAARDIARAEDLADAGYRTVMNIGADGVRPCSGGRRSTQREVSSLTRNVRLDRPPEMNSARRSPLRGTPASRRCRSRAVRSRPSRSVTQNCLPPLVPGQ